MGVVPDEAMLAQLQAAQVDITTPTTAKINMTPSSPDKKPIYFCWIKLEPACCLDHLS
jgi:hypothetical protein